MARQKLPTCRIQRLIEHLLPVNFTVQYLPGEKMHIADILSRLAGKDLEPSDQLILISFNVLTRSKSKLTQPLKLYTAEKHKQSQLPPQKNLQKQHAKPQVTTSKPVQTKTIQPQKKLNSIYYTSTFTKTNYNIYITSSTSRYFEKIFSSHTSNTPERGKKIFS